MAGGKAGKDSGKSKQKAVSRSARAGLQFPVGRIHRHLKSRSFAQGRWVFLKLGFRLKRVIKQRKAFSLN